MDVLIFSILDHSASDCSTAMLSHFLSLIFSWWPCFNSALTEISSGFMYIHLYYLNAYCHGGEIFGWNYISTIVPLCGDEKLPLCSQLNPLAKVHDLLLSRDPFVKGSIRHREATRLAVKACSHSLSARLALTSLGCGHDNLTLWLSPETTSQVLVPSF